MPHSMSHPWLDWLPMVHEPNGYEVLLYLSDEGEVWAGNHPEGCARGMWTLDRGGAADTREPVMWAHIPLPAHF